MLQYLHVQRKFFVIVITAVVLIVIHVVHVVLMVVQVSLYNHRERRQFTWLVFTSWILKWELDIIEKLVEKFLE